MEEYNNNVTNNEEQVYTGETVNTEESKKMDAPKILAIISLVLGILSCTCCCGYTSIPAVVVGIIGLVKKRDVMGIVGIALGALSLIIVIAMNLLGVSISLLEM